MSAAGYVMYFGSALLTAVLTMVCVNSEREGVRMACICAAVLISFLAGRLSA